MAGRKRSGLEIQLHVTASDRTRNLVIVCSPKSNSFTQIFQDKLRTSHPTAFAFESDINKEWMIIDCDGGEYHSKSYKQVKDYINRKIAISELPAQAYEDYAVVTKVTNPWNDKSKVVWVAGIRGIGTWGAAECIKKEWRQIYSKLLPENKDCDFSAILKINYNNCDITSINVLRVKPIGESKMIYGR